MCTKAACRFQNWIVSSAGGSSGLLIEQIKAASESQRRLTIQGHGSKGRLLPAVSNDGLLTLGEHSGILQYEPEELVITARGGTAYRKSTQS